MRYLAIDYGVRRTGLAICDPDETIASPLCLIESNKRLLERLVDLVERENVEAIVLGLPLNMDDSVGPAAKRVYRLAEQIEEKLHLPVYFEDERLTSFTARQKLLPADLTRAERKRYLDAVAAAEILQSFLERKRNKPEPVE